MIEKNNIPKDNTGDSGEPPHKTNSDGLIILEGPPKIEPATNDQTKRKNNPPIWLRLWRVHRRRQIKRQKGISPANVAEKLTVFVTLVIAGTGIVQSCIYYQQKGIMESSGAQTDKLIAAANTQATAADRFATAANGINTQS